MVLGSPRVPFSRRTLVDEDQLLDQLDLIRLSLPPAFRDATALLQQRDTLISEAERYAQDLIAAAEQEAAQILDEIGIVRQAEQMAQQIKTQTQQECDALRSQTLSEVDRMRLQAQQEWETLRQQALADQATIQADADAYAHDVLGQIEQQLSQMLRIIQNGRGQLQRPASEVLEAPSGATARTGRPPTSSPHRVQPSARPDRPTR